MPEAHWSYGLQANEAAYSVWKVRKQLRDRKVESLFKGMITECCPHLEKEVTIQIREGKTALENQT